MRVQILQLTEGVSNDVTTNEEFFTVAKGKR